jgi:hypothetical protein
MSMKWNGANSIEKWQERNCGQSEVGWVKLKNEKKIPPKKLKQVLNGLYYI